MTAYIVPVLAALVAMCIVGFVWYGPLFGKAWSKYTGIKENDKEMKKNMWKYMLKNQLFALIGVIALTYIVVKGTPKDEATLAIRTIVIWIAFTVPAVMSSTIWERKAFGLGMINMFGSLACLLVGGFVLMKLL